MKKRQNMDLARWESGTDHTAGTGMRRIVLCLALLVSTMAVAVGVASPAQAASCSTSSRYVTSSVAETAFTVALCNDRTARVSNGRLYDTNCDNRSAQVRFSLGVYSHQVAPPRWVEVYSNIYKVTVGCGGSATYPTFTLGPLSSFYATPTAQYRFRVALSACNSLGCSSTYYNDRTYYLSSL